MLIVVLDDGHGVTPTPRSNGIPSSSDINRLRDERARKNLPQHNKPSRRPGLNLGCRINVAPSHVGEKERRLYPCGQVHAVKLMTSGLGVRDNLHILFGIHTRHVTRMHRTPAVVSLA